MAAPHLEAELGTVCKAILPDKNARMSAWSPDLPNCRDVAKVSYAQQDFPSWIGGHGTVAYEQYTQQSPSRGFRTVLQALHS